MACLSVGFAVALAASCLGYLFRGARPIGIVLITLDTTRADRLSPYGFMNVSLPHLERLAREGIVFDQATSVAPLTLPAHASLLTGLLPPNHRVRDNADRALALERTTLAEILLARGFRTAAIVGSDVLHPDRGLAQGFELYRTAAPVDGVAAHPGQRRGDEVMTDAIKWLDGVTPSRFFLWVHLYDPHRPYDPPEPYASIYGHNPYVGEIAFADSQIGRLLQALDALLDRTIVIVTGDHGESLGEHGERDHGNFVYENVLRVPLIVRAPGLAPFRVGEVVRLTDVMPTALALLGIPVPPVDGVSLLEAMRGQRRLDLEAYSESLYPARFGWSPLHALRDGRFKVVDAPRPELFDLDLDPLEEHDISGERPLLARAMIARAAAIAGGRASARTSTSHGPVTPELQARLAALGYAGSAAGAWRPGPSSLPDPKDCIDEAGCALPGIQKTGRSR
jgi:arylsulfatase A-like enzyme